MINLEQILNSYPEFLQVNPRAILREYLQCKILQYLMISPIAHKLVFIGGTSIRILHGSQRFSEDLDFDNFGLQEAEFLDASHSIKKSLEREGLEVELVSSINKKVFHYKIKFPTLFYKYGLSGHQNEKLFIKVDSEAQGIDYKVETRLLQSLDVQTQVRCPSLGTLLAQKLVAYFDRVQGRDLYDICFLRGLAEPNYDYLKAKIALSSRMELKDRILARLTEMDSTVLLRDIGRFLFFPERDLAYVNNFQQFVQEKF